MRVVVVAGAIVACSLRLASAQTPPAALVAPMTSPEYPLAITDRPILLYPGMTELDLSEDFPTYTRTTVDAMGNATTTRTGLADNRTPALNVAHAFGPVQVSVGLGQLAGAEVNLNTGVVPEVLTLWVSSSFLSKYQDPNFYYDRQGFGIGHKVHVAPGRFAVYGGGSVSLIEHASTLDNGMVSADHVVWLGVGATAELQLTRRLAVTRAEESVKSVVVRWAIGAATPRDVVRTRVAAPFIVSDRVVSLLRDFSGWNTYDVSLIGKTGSAFPGYRGLAVTGRCGPITDSRPIKFQKLMPGGRFPWWRGLYFEPKTWDGSDVFMPTGRSGWIFVVERVRRALEKAKIKNVVFTALDNVERMSLR
jgi:hypothetical protein